jgi:hypothetical protein
VTTQDPQRQGALMVGDKSRRVANFHASTVRALAELVAAAGLSYPGQLRPHHIARRVSITEVRILSGLYPDMVKGELLEGKYRQTLFRLGWPMAQAESFEPLHSLSEALLEQADAHMAPAEEHVA